MAMPRATERTLLLACLLACALGEEDASCMLQAQHAASVREHAAEASQGFCTRTDQLNFNSFEHGETPSGIDGVTIDVERRSTRVRRCPGPLMVLDTNDFTPDNDLQNCQDCKLLLYSKNGNTNKVTDCGEKPGPKIIFNFHPPRNLSSIKLWDLEDPTFVETYTQGGELTQNISFESGDDQDGVGEEKYLDRRSGAVKKLVVLLGGSGAVEYINICRPHTGLHGDPHIYTLDGDKFDLYENGTFSVFRYAGQQPWLPSPGAVDWQLFSHYGGPLWTAQALLLVDRSMGHFRQALELSAKDCQWRQKTGDGDWVEAKRKQSVSLLEEDKEYKTGFEFFHEKKLALRKNTRRGHEDTLILNTACKPSGINLRITMPDMAESRFVQGQIEVGNGVKQAKHALAEGWDWARLGGTDAVASFIHQLPTRQFSLLALCEEADRLRADAICTKHLSGLPGSNADIHSDCVADVCRGGEEFAVAAAEMLSEDVEEEV